MVKKIFLYPSANLVTVIPAILLMGFFLGYLIDTSVLKNYILLATFIMIYPTMIGFKFNEAINMKYAKVVGISLIINFLIIPLLAFVLGISLLNDQPQLFAGLAVAALLPTSGMTISWTMIYKGNVPAAIKMTVISLIAGSILTPWYLLAMVGKYVAVDVVATFQTIVLVVLLPLLLGTLTHKLVMVKMSNEEFQKNIKPFLPALSVWAMLFVIFSSISLKAKMILAQPQLLIQAVIVLLIFYILNFALVTVIARLMFNKQDSYALVYGTVMRNLSLSLGLAVTAFGAKAALIVTLAFILQVQGAAWYGKLTQKYRLFEKEEAQIVS